MNEGQKIRLCPLKGQVQNFVALNPIQDKPSLDFS